MLEGSRLPLNDHTEKEEQAMSGFIVGVFEGDVDAWKERFFSDPLGRKQVAKGHRILRGADNPNRVFVASSSSGSMTREGVR